MTLAAVLVLLLAPFEVDVTTARLDNGMTVLVSRDPSVSDVAVELWVRVGSADEAPGQHGWAHLFEHMLPSPRLLANPQNRALFERDRLDSNGATAVDYTRWVARVPATSVELPIAVYAGRLMAGPDAISAEDLAKHQQTVLAEFRNGAGRTWDAAVVGPIRRALFGDHPYGHAVMGSTFDVEAATLDDMRRWFRRYYGASNAMLVVVGNAEPARVLELARKHFGAIAAGSTFAPAAPPMVPLPARKSLTVVAAEARPAVELHWRTPRWSDPSRQHLAMAKELYRRRLAGAVGCEVVDGEELEAAAGGATSLRIRCGDVVEARALAELDAFLGSTPPVDAAREHRLAAHGDTLTRLGWRPSRAQLLAEGLWLAGDARAYLRQLERIEAATPEEVMKSAREWMRHPLVVRVAPAVVAAQAPDPEATLAIPMPSIEVPADVVDGSERGVRVLTVRRAMPIVLAHLVARGGSVESIAATPATFDRELRELVARAKGAFDLVVVGDVERQRVLGALPNAALPSPAVSDPPPFTPKAGAPQTTLTGIITYAAGTDAARVAVAADLLRVRLNDRLREKERWVYSVDARFERRGGAPAIVVQVPIRDDLAMQAIPVMQSYIDALAAEKLTAAEAARAKGAELRRLAALASAPYDLANALVSVVRSGDSYAAYTRAHAALFETLREGAALDLPKPLRTAWTASGDPERVDPRLRR